MTTLYGRTFPWYVIYADKREYATYDFTMFLRVLASISSDHIQGYGREYRYSKHPSSYSLGSREGI